MSVEWAFLIAGIKMKKRFHVNTKKAWPCFSCHHPDGAILCMMDNPVGHAAEKKFFLL